MLRPLKYVVCAILLIAFVNYLPATACKNSSQIKASTTVDMNDSNDAVVTVSICDSADLEECSTIDTVKSTLRAGKAVGKAMVTTAVVVASSMARAARHAALALVESAYSLV